MLHLHRSERADALVAPLAALLADPPEDPFTPDVVAVPTRGVERWLAQRLSHLLGAGPDGEPGVCANVTFGSPARLVADVLATVTGVPDDDPWQTDRLTWPLLEVIDAHAAEPWCAPLGRYLGAADADDLRRGRRLGAARHLARLFASYAAQRPDMVRAWAEGRDDDGAGAPVPGDLVWQVELWRRLRDHVGEPSPAERLDDALRAVSETPAAVDLPDRISVFGPTRLPEDQLRVLRALAVHRDVHLWLPHPSPALWDRVAAAGAPVSPRRREQDHHAEHPLLASMARDATELETRLTAAEDDGGVTVAHHRPPARAGNLLGALQERLAADDPEAEPHTLATGDGSVQVHSCHGLARQVDVLREVLAALFADDPTLEPRDVIVMCPDVEAVAPLITASFGLAPDGATDVHPGHTMRVRLADRAPGRTNPVLTLLATLLNLADGRVTASEVLDLAAAEPVRRRFRFSDDDLDRIRDWSVTAGVRWGEDGGRRARFDLPGVLQGTWQVALDRILLGAAMAEEDHRYVGHALPLDDVDSTDIDLAGRLAEHVDRLTATLADLDGAHPLDHWLDVLDRAVTHLADTAPADSWQVVQARRVLGDVRLHAAGEHPGSELRLPDLRALLADRLAGRPSRAGFRTGALTVCSLEPMRAVPHRVVCLLGVDDGAFPRGTRQDGDDILLRDPCIGERDRRSEDRQLFLDAVTAAEDHLVVLYSGAHERTGADRPPAVPVGELLDALDRAATTADGASVREHVLRRHPLQVVDERNFVPGALGRDDQPFSFDAVSHRAAVAGRGERVDRPPFLTEPLPAPAADLDGAAGTVDLTDLIAMLEHPVKFFLRHRLGLSVAGEVAEVDDRLPLTLDPLDAWATGERFLQARLEGVPDSRAINAEWRRGTAPPKELGRTALLDVGNRVVPIADAARAERSDGAEAVDVVVDLPSGVTLAGTVPGVHGTTVLRATYSRLAPKHRLRAWVQLLALAAAHPGRPWRTATVGRPTHNRPGVYVARLTAPGQAEALDLLDRLVSLRSLALREPLPVPVPVACTYATARYGGDSVDMALVDAHRAWSGDQFLREDEHHVICWGPGAGLDDILGVPTEAEQAWFPDDRTRLGVLARRVWQPLLAHEQVDKP
ncbi:exodeoxyribonuclease V subunit gamma [Georgenia subflava]|uniref:RecBCD enzyme subunit RecC n=1 Tax=Georgenia subflava TaxID=1622177 RepID=A0A6N7EPS1_9MICO|nr:exodeoxyribonuclease V subunit gamma [Georgenia subflava]MPV38156.1 exodeoxyribonuclease V subunit gamma [Georgenia subflava]